MIQFLMLAALASPPLLPSSAGAPAITPLDPPARPGSMAPNLTAHGDTLLLSWLEPVVPGSKPGEGSMSVRYSRFDGAKWSPPRTVIESPKIFANWADFPAIAASKPGWLLAGWPEKSGAGAYDYFLELARAEGPDRAWRRLGPVHEDRTASEHGFVSFVPEGDSVRAFWLDGRDTKAEAGSMSLRTAVVGESAGPSERLDAKVCDCCQTSAAATSDGPIVAYRDRSDSEVRDVSVVRRAGGRWTRPRSVGADGWKIAGCPVNGPALAASARRVVVAWFTVALERPRVRLAFSQDAGATFGRPVDVDAEEPAGRVDVALAENGDAILSWVAVEGKEAWIRFRRVTPEGAAGPPVTVSPTSVARSSGFPRLERLGKDLLVCWVEASEPFRLHAARVPVSAVPAASPR